MELKPCPFCGESGEEIRDYTYHIPGNIYIGIFYCCNCGGAMIDTDKNHCWLDRTELWNNRFCADSELKEQADLKAESYRQVTGKLMIKRQQLQKLQQPL